jgi:asparagine synthetase B (glutamine-hydrolysing)
MTLPPLANLVAFRFERPGLARGLRLALLKDDADLFEPASGWLIATTNVGAGPSPSAGPASPYFVEGAELFADAAARARIGEVAEKSPERLASHAGDFGFLHVTEQGEAVVVRSCGGRVPFYVWRGPGLTVVSTTLSQVARFMSEEPRLDGLACAAWMTGWSLWPYGRTFFEGVSAVARGHAVRISDGRVSRDTRYWDPRPHALPRPTPETRAEHVESLRKVLFSSLERELDPDGRNLLTLSGGVDSSSLAAISAGPLERSVDTVTLMVPGEEARSREMGYLESLRKAVPLGRSWEIPLDLRGRVELVRAAPRVAFPMFHPALGALPRIVEERKTTVLFGGEFADEICGSSFTIPDWFRDTGLLTMLRHPHHWPNGRRTPLRWLVRRAGDAARRPYWPLPEETRHEFLVPAVRKEFRQWMNEWKRAEARDGRPLRYLSLQAEADGFVAMNWEAASSLGVRRAWPFFSRAALELAFDCHPMELVGPGIKKLMRAALAGDVPERNLHRADRGHSAVVPQRVELPDLPPALGSVFARPPTTEEQSKEGWPLVDPFVQLWAAVEELRRGGPPSLREDGL